MVSDTEGGRAVDGRYTGVGRGRSLTLRGGAVDGRYTGVGRGWSLTLRGAGLWMVGTRGWVGGGL